MSLVEDIVNKILKNEEFKKNCKDNILAILKDGKLDSTDTPYILTIIVDIYNNTDDFKITKDKVEDVLKLLLMKLLGELNLLNDENKEITEKLIESSLKLLTKKIKQSKMIDKFMKWIKSGCKCSCCCK